MDRGQYISGLFIRCKLNLFYGNGGEGAKTSFADANPGRILNILLLGGVESEGGFGSG